MKNNIFCELFDPCTPNYRVRVVWPSLCCLIALIVAMSKSDLTAAEPKPKSNVPGIDQTFGFPLYIKIKDSARKDVTKDAKLNSLSAIYAQAGFREDKTYAGASLIYRLVPLPATTNRQLNLLVEQLMATGIVEKVVPQFAVASSFDLSELGSPKSPAATLSTVELRGFKSMKSRALTRRIDYSKPHVPNRLLICITEEAIWRYGLTVAKEKLLTLHSRLGSRVVSEIALGEGVVIQVVEINLALRAIEKAVEAYMIDDLVDYADLDFLLPIDVGSKE